jgi:hypothetical protein
MLEAHALWPVENDSDRLIGSPPYSGENASQLRSHGGHTTAFYSGMDWIRRERGRLKMNYLDRTELN